MKSNTANILLKGELMEYKPWIQIQDFPSKGDSFTCKRPYYGKNPSPNVKLGITVFPSSGLV